MSARPRLPAACVAALLLVASTAHGQEHPGRALYDRWCAECHGVEGRGDGPAAAYMLPRPRDFTQARYQIRTTGNGELPTDADLMRIIENGMPGTAMPGWPKLTRRDREQLVSYLKTFSHFFESEAAPQSIAIGRAPRSNDEALAEGRRVYDQLECWKCHGQAGRGDGQSAPTLEDDAGWAIRPADLTQNWRFNGGGTVQDIYTRLRTGIDGTPMPSQTDLIDAGVITDAQLWNVAQYVRSLSPEKPPVAREVVRAVRREGELPAGTSDEEWADVPRSWIPLVGQIIETPRWFAPTVSAVWVQAVHDGAELVLRIVWNDPSRSPDPVWTEWFDRLSRTLEHDEPPAGGALPDALAVQFATAPASGRDLPYFLMGDARTPVHLWHWQSDGTVTERIARGLDRTEVLAGAAAVHGTAEFADGQWRLVLRRTLDVPGEDRPAFRAGEPIPIAFYAWDGSSGETGKRVAIGSWYFLFLEQPVTAGVYIIPLIAAAITLLLCLAAIHAARRTSGTSTETAVAPAGAAAAVREPALEP